MSNHLEVIVDGIIYKLQSTGGISRLFTETLPRVCEKDNSLNITLLISGVSAQRLPVHNHIHHKRIPSIGGYLHPFFFSKRLRTRIEQCWNNQWIGRGKGKIWHSTYYTMPEKWNGKQVVTVADMIYERYPNLFAGPASDEFRKMKKRCVLAADAVLSISEATGRDLQMFYDLDPGRIHVVHLACSDFFRPLMPGTALSDLGLTDAPFFLYVGSRAHYKNFAAMITAYSRWKGSRDVRFVVVGSEWTSDELNSLKDLGIENRVDLLNIVDDNALCVLYNRALAFVYPSHYEGFGIPLLEAMACGCPVIASKIDTTVEVAGVCPIYFELESKDSMIAAFDIAVKEGRENPRTRRALQRAGEFSWDKCAQGTLDVYRSLS